MATQGRTPGMANGPCVEQPITVWRKSARSSDPELAQCVEVARIEMRAA